MLMAKHEVVHSEEVHPGIVLDFNKQNEVVGIEILRVKSSIPPAYLKQMWFSCERQRPRRHCGPARDLGRPSKAIM
jgi:uncharacterized protein YuzE